VRLRSHLLRRQRARVIAAALTFVGMLMYLQARQRPRRWSGPRCPLGWDAAASTARHSCSTRRHAHLVVRSAPLSLVAALHGPAPDPIATIPPARSSSCSI
jgi:hypothetical protein